MYCAQAGNSELVFGFGIGVLWPEEDAVDVVESNRFADSFFEILRSRKDWNVFFSGCFQMADIFRFVCNSGKFCIGLSLKKLMVSK